MSFVIVICLRCLLPKSRKDNLRSNMYCRCWFQTLPVFSQSRNFSFSSKQEFEIVFSPICVAQRWRELVLKKGNESSCESHKWDKHNSTNELNLLKNKPQFLAVDCRLIFLDFSLSRLHSDIPSSGFWQRGPSEHRQFSKRQTEKVKQATSRLTCAFG